MGLKGCTGWQEAQRFSYRFYSRTSQSRSIRLGSTAPFLTLLEALCSPRSVRIWDLRAPRRCARVTSGPATQASFALAFGATAVITVSSSFPMLLETTIAHSRILADVEVPEECLSPHLPFVPRDLSSPSSLEILLPLMPFAHRSPIHRRRRTKTLASPTSALLEILSINGPAIKSSQRLIIRVSVRFPWSLRGITTAIRQLWMDRSARAGGTRLIGPLTQIPALCFAPTAKHSSIRSPLLHRHGRPSQT